MEYYAAIRRNEMLVHAMIQMKLEDISFCLYGSLQGNCMISIYLKYPEQTKL